MGCLICLDAPLCVLSSQPCAWEITALPRVGPCQLGFHRGCRLSHVAREQTLHHVGEAGEVRTRRGPLDIREKSQKEAGGGIVQKRKESMALRGWSIGAGQVWTHHTHWESLSFTSVGDLQTRLCLERPRKEPWEWAEDSGGCRRACVNHSDPPEITPRSRLVPALSRTRPAKAILPLQLSWQVAQLPRSPEQSARAGDLSLP